MIIAEHTQTVADFKQTSTETLDRLNRTDEAEILTVDGEPRAVLLSPAAYDALAREADLNRDAAGMRESIRQLDAGQGQEVNAFLDDVRAKLLAMRAEQEQGVERGSGCPPSSRRA